MVPEKDYEEVFSQTAAEIQILSDDINTLLNECTGKKNPLNLCKRKIINFFAKCFLNVWIYRMVSQLKRRHRLRTDNSTELARSLGVTVATWLESKQQNSLVLGFHTVSNDKSIFTPTVSEFIYKSVSPETDGKDTERNLKLYTDIKKKTWKLESSMNWFLNSLVVKFAAKVSFLLPNRKDEVDDPEDDLRRLIGETLQTLEGSQAEEEQEEDRASPHSESEQSGDLDTFIYDEEPIAAESKVYSEERAPHLVFEEESQEAKDSIRAFVQFLTEKILDHIYHEAKIAPQYNDEYLNDLLTHIWPQVWDNTATLSLTDKSFEEMDRTIHNSLCKTLGSPNEILFKLKYSEEPFIEKCAVSIAKKLLKPPKSNFFQRCCCFLWLFS